MTVNEYVLQNVFHGLHIAVLLWLIVCWGMGHAIKWVDAMLKG